MLSWIIFVPIDTDDAEIYWIDEEPNTTKSPWTYIDAETIWLPIKVLLPVVAYEPVFEFRDVILLDAVNVFKDVLPLLDVNVFILLTDISTLADFVSNLTNVQC